MTIHSRVFRIAAVLAACAFYVIPAAAWEDHTHYSAAFGKEKTYRIYFPDDYAATATRYPAIYFFHGWGGRYNADPNAKYDSTLIQTMVGSSQVIMVFWDGNMLADPYEPRPYNVGNHQHVRFQTQMADYFPELVGHVDSTYRTIPDREHRALYGYSMGGFMSWVIAGKYPQMLYAAVDMLGSAEFFIGYPDNHVLYSHRYMCSNLYGLHLFQHNSTTGPLVHLNREVRLGALREKGLSYEYKEYPGGHGVDAPGEITVFKEHFDWLVDKMASPLPRPARWHHRDPYGSFSVWGYAVTSDKDIPGFLTLRGVTAGGMEVGSSRWEPDGPAIPGLQVTVTTDTIYEKNTVYKLFRYDAASGSTAVSDVTSSGSGSVSFTTDGTRRQFGIYRAGDPGEPVLAGYAAGAGTTAVWVEQDEPADLRLKVLNRGGSVLDGLTATLSSPEAVIISDSVISIGTVGSGAAIWTPEAFKVTVQKRAPVNAAPWRVRFTVTFRDGSGSSWDDEFDVPVKFTVDVFNDVAIDDGRLVADSVFGTGNGNGVIDPGERVMIFANGRRLRLYTDDPYVVAAEERLHDEALPAIWTDDGITLTSIVKIADDAPAGHPFTFLGNYESKSFNPILRMLRWGKVTSTTGKKAPESGSGPGRMNFRVPGPWQRYDPLPLPENGSFTLASLTGRQVFATRRNPADMAAVHPGLYICRIETGGPVIYHGPLVIIE